jgi:hypothetical protein
MQNLNGHRALRLTAGQAPARAHGGRLYLLVDLAEFSPCDLDPYGHRWGY